MASDKRTLSHQTYAVKRRRGRSGYLPRPGVRKSQVRPPDRR
jgi:hypothetical protein